MSCLDPDYTYPPDVQQERQEEISSLLHKGNAVLGDVTSERHTLLLDVGEKPLQNQSNESPKRLAPQTNKHGNKLAQSTPNKTIPAGHVDSACLLPLLDRGPCCCLPIAVEGSRAARHKETRGKGREGRRNLTGFRSFEGVRLFMKNALWLSGRK